MIINQKRVRGLSKLKDLEVGSKVRLVVTDVDSPTAARMGFTNDLEVGECVLPTINGPSSRRNSNGHYIIHRDREKETMHRMIEWTYKQWNGPDDYSEVTDSTQVPYLRYPRTLILPPSIEFTIVDLGGRLSISSPEMILGEEDENIKTSINVLLECFGYCEVFTKDMNPFLPKKIIKLNWNVLPKGEYPWDVQKTRIEPFLCKAKGANRMVVEKRHETINGYNPDFSAVGRGGFSGYMVHGFEKRDLFVLESTEVNNATYVIRGNWESISQLTKREILRNELHEHRVIHNGSWYDAMGNILK